MENEKVTLGVLELFDLINDRIILEKVRNQNEELKKLVMNSLVENYYAKEKDNSDDYESSYFMFEDRNIIKLMDCGITLDEIIGFAKRYKAIVGKKDKE